MKISDRDKRFLAVGGLAVVVYLLITLVINPIYATQVRNDREIQEKVRFIQKYYEVLNQKAYYEKKNKQNEEVQKSLSRRFLEGKKPGLAAAGLQKILEGFASKSSIKVDRVRVEKHKFTESFMVIPIEVTLRASLKNLTQFIYQIESYEKFLVIEELNSRRINKTDPEQLQATILISGFILNGEPEGTKENMKRFWLALSILILALSQSCATDKTSAVQKLIHAKDPIEAMKFPEKTPASTEAENGKQEEPIIEIKAGDETSQQEIIDPEVLDAIPDKPVIKQVQIQANKARLRKGPGLQYKITGSAYKGDTFTLLGIREDPETRQSWYLIKDQDDKKYFISSILAKVIEGRKEPSDHTEDLNSLKADKVSPGKSIIQKRQVQTSRQYRRLIDPTPPLPPELKKAKHITLNFEGTEIYDVITTFCELLKLDYFIEGGIQGKVTLQTFNKIPVQDLYVVLEQILALHNVTVVRSGHFYRFLPIKDATQKPMSVHYGYDSAIPAKERLIIEIIPLKHISSDSMKKIITPLLTKNASFIDVPDTSNLMLIEMAYNVKRILNVVTALDIDKLSASDIQLYKIEHADCRDYCGRIERSFFIHGI